MQRARDRTTIPFPTADMARAGRPRRALRPSRAPGTADRRAAALRRRLERAACRCLPPAPRTLPPLSARKANRGARSPQIRGADPPSGKAQSDLGTSQKLAPLDGYEAGLLVALDLEEDRLT